MDGFLIQPFNIDSFFIVVGKKEGGLVGLSTVLVYSDWLPLAIEQAH